jgi:hypothetical protein
MVSTITRRPGQVRFSVGGVGDEVLPPLLGGPQAEPGSELADPRSAQKLRGDVHPRSFWVRGW